MLNPTFDIVEDKGNIVKKGGDPLESVAQSLTTKQDIEQTQRDLLNIKKDTQREMRLDTQRQEMPFPLERQEESRIPTHIDSKIYTLIFPIGTLKIKISGDTFLFHDQNEIYMGQFSIEDIILYVSQFNSQADIPDEQDKLDERNKRLIELAICKKVDITQNKIELCVNSPFMNDIEILMILNKYFKRFEETSIQKYSSNEKKIKVIRNLIYAVITHTINTITIISKQIKHSDNEKLKNKLMKYSIGLVYRLTQYLNASIIQTESKFGDIFNAVEKLKVVEEKLESKVNEIKL